MKFPFISWCFYSFRLRLWTARLSQTYAYVVGTRDPPVAERGSTGTPAGGLDLVARVLVDPAESTMEASTVTGRILSALWLVTTGAAAQRPLPLLRPGRKQRLPSGLPFPCGGNYISW